MIDCWIAFSREEILRRPKRLTHAGIHIHCAGHLSWHTQDFRNKPQHLMQRPCWDPSGTDSTLPLPKSSPLCIMWPPYSTSTTAEERSEPFLRLRAGIEHTLRKISSDQGKLEAGDLDRLASRRCASRQCLRVQILQQRLYVVAPHSKYCTDSDPVSYTHLTLPTILLV